MTERTLVSSGSEWEPKLGYSRAVRAGNTVYVSGTVGVEADGTVALSAGAQARRALEIIGAALEQAGARMEDVVRTRVFMTDIADFDEIGEAHGAVFGEIRPALTILQVCALAGPAYRVEIEAEAIV